MKKFSFSDLKNKTCIITGGAGVIGETLCMAMASAGINVAIVDLDEKKSKKLASELREKYKTECIGLVANVLEKESLLEVKKIINKNLGEVDFLINGAGGNSPKATTQLEQILDEDITNLEKSFFGLEIDGFEKVFALNFTGTLLPTIIFAREMVERKKGVILNISSMNSYRPLTKIPAYSAAKASINNFTQWLAVHLAKVGIRVNAIAPGFFLTNQNRFLLTDEKTGKPTPRGNKIIASTPMGKYGDPEHLQGITLFLLSEMSSFITGVIIPVDGGFSAYGGV